MQRSAGRAAMEQSVYNIVLQWMVGMPAWSHFRHLTRFDFGTVAYEYLYFSTVAWCPVRPAAHRVALQLFVLDSRGDVQELDMRGAQVERRVRRAVGLTTLPLGLNAGVVELVRSLARQYSVERAVSVYARHGDRHGPGRESSERLRRLVAETTREDVDSPSGSEPDEQEERGSEDSQGSASSEEQ